MTKDEFIFSNKISPRVARHLGFWAVYCTYFFIQSLAPRKYTEFFLPHTYYSAFLNLSCFGPVLIFTVYFFIYILLPQTLKKERYTEFVAGFLMVYILGTLINYFTAEIFFYEANYPVVPNFQHRLEFGNYNTRWGMIIATIALGIKLSKDWYLQQNENLQILRKKSRSEVQLQKSRIHPELLFRSLGNIYLKIRSGSRDSNSMILNLSDLLSYSLYESDTKLVPLEKELFELHRLVSLEQSTRESLINIQVQTGGETRNRLIAPMILVKLVEESLNVLHTAGSSSWLMGVHITAVETSLSLNLLFINLKHAKLPDIQRRLISNTGKRLSEYYLPTEYHIELIEGQIETVIRVNINLAAGPLKEDNLQTLNFNTIGYDPA